MAEGIGSSSSERGFVSSSSLSGDSADSEVGKSSTNRGGSVGSVWGAAGVVHDNVGTAVGASRNAVVISDTLGVVVISVDVSGGLGHGDEGKEGKRSHFNLINNL